MLLLASRFFLISQETRSDLQLLVWYRRKILQTSRKSFYNSIVEHLNELVTDVLLIISYTCQRELFLGEDPKRFGGMPIFPWQINFIIDSFPRLE